MTGDFEIGAGDETFDRLNGADPNPEPIEDEWSADAPPQPYMGRVRPDRADAPGSPSDRLLGGGIPWIRRAG